MKNNLNHSIYECKYHLVFIPKYRKKELYGEIRTRLGDVFHRLAGQKECEIIEGHLVLDHVHMLISIPPKHAVSKIVGFLKGKSSIWIAQNIAGRQRNFLGAKFWARGYFISTIGLDEAIVQQYIINQSSEDRRLDNLLSRS